MFALRLSLLALLCLPAFAPAQERTSKGLVALYDFRETEGAIIHDQSGAGTPIHLKIENPKAVRQTAGALEVVGKTRIRSEKDPKRLVQAIAATGEFTIEAWIRPANTSQEGPARIVSLSKNTSERNFTLGQEKDHYDLRFRTTSTSKNGTPSVESPRKSLKSELTHVVYSRDHKGRARIFLNGKTVADKKVDGVPRNWDSDFSLLLANESTGDRPWQGTFYLVAIYNEELEPGEIESHFLAGIDAAVPASTLAKAQEALQERFFTTDVAPLLAEHCLECHDSATQEGDLDLSRKDLAMAAAITPGQAEKSELWLSVETDDMPHKRTPLTAEEKQVLKRWIDQGAVWARDRIDPALYKNGASSGDIWVQRLTVDEYIETVRATLGVDIGEEARQLLPKDLRADGFSNTAYNLNVDLKHVEAYARLAELIVDRMDPVEFAQRFGKGRSVEDKPMRALIEKMGVHVLRGPLTGNEVTLYRGITTTVAAAGGDYDEAVAYLLEAMLQAPRFIYRMENHPSDGGSWPVDDYALASRLSYILWGGPPDARLLQAAEKKELGSPDRLREEIDRMLKDPRTVDRSMTFAKEWLHLDRLASLRPNPKKFPNWNAELAADMREETLAFFKQVVWEEQRPLTDLLNAQFTVASPELAQHYGLNPVGDSAARYDLASVPGRGGLLTQGSVLTIGGDQASMVSRGLFVLHDLLHGVVKDPPPCVDTTPVPTKAGLTQRAIAEERVASKNCGGCHSKFEPLAFGLEKFDGIGAFYNEDEHGNLLREDGEILFPGEAEPVSYDTSDELMNLLANSDRVRECMTWKLAQFALGRPLTALDAPVLDSIQVEADKNGYTYPALIKAILMSDLVRKSAPVIDP